jgi:hypothetical protein
MNHKALWIAFNTIVTKEVRRFVRIWPQTLLPPAITMSLYFIIFGQLIGSRIGEMGVLGGVLKNGGGHVVVPLSRSTNAKRQ